MKFTTREKTLLSTVILFLLCINLLPILTATAGPPPDKGKPGKGKPEGQTIAITFSGNIEGVIPESHSDLVNGLLTHTRAHVPHVVEYPLTLDSVFEGGEEPFAGTHSGRDFEMILDWTTDSSGTILFYFSFDYGEYDDESEDNYKLLDEEGTFTYFEETYTVTLDDAEILYRLGPGKKNYDTRWSGSVNFEFTIDY